MYAIIMGQAWAEDSQPPITERHGWLEDPATGVVYGRILNEEDQAAVVQALIELRLQQPLPFDV